jgi:hypothetical protein
LSRVQFSTQGAKWIVYFGDVGDFCGLDSNKGSDNTLYLIVTDSMSSLKALQTRRVAPRTHSLVYKIKEACWWLKNNEYEIHMMWIPLHVGVRGNERVAQLAGDAVEKAIEWHSPVRPSDFLHLSRVRLLDCWQIGWNCSDMGRYAYSIWPVTG